MKDAEVLDVYDLSPEDHIPAGGPMGQAVWSGGRAPRGGVDSLQREMLASPGLSLGMLKRRSLRCVDSIIIRILDSSRPCDSLPC